MECVYIEDDDTLVLTKQHEVLMLGDFADKECSSGFIELGFAQSSKFVSMSCSGHRVLFLTSDGMVYSWGRDESRTGVLGHDQNFEFDRPAGVQNLIEFT